MNWGRLKTLTTTLKGDIKPLPELAIGRCAWAESIKRKANVASDVHSTYLRCYKLLCKVASPTARNSIKEIGLEKLNPCKMWHFYMTLKMQFIHLKWNFMRGDTTQPDFYCPSKSLGVLRM